MPVDLTRATVPEAAEALGKSEATIRRWCDAGKLSHFREPTTDNRRVDVQAYLDGKPSATSYADAADGEATIRMTGVLKGDRHMGGRAWVAVECDVPVSALRTVSKPASLDVAMAHTEAVLYAGYELQMGRKPKGSR